MDSKKIDFIGFSDQVINDAMNKVHYMYVQQNMFYSMYKELEHNTSGDSAEMGDKFSEDEPLDLCVARNLSSTTDNNLHQYASLPVPSNKCDKESKIEVHGSLYSDGSTVSHEGNIYGENNLAKQAYDSCVEESRMYLSCDNQQSETRGKSKVDLAVRNVSCSVNGAGYDLFHHDRSKSVPCDETGTTLPQNETPPCTSSQDNHLGKHSQNGVNYISNHGTMDSLKSNYGLLNTFEFGAGVPNKDSVCTDNCEQLCVLAETLINHFDRQANIQPINNDLKFSRSALQNQSELASDSSFKHSIDCVKNHPSNSGGNKAEKCYEYIINSNILGDCDIRTENFKSNELEFLTPSSFQYINKSTDVDGTSSTLYPLDLHVEKSCSVPSQSASKVSNSLMLLSEAAIGRQIEQGLLSMTNPSLRNEQSVVHSNAEQCSESIAIQHITSAGTDELNNSDEPYQQDIKVDMDVASNVVLDGSSTTEDNILGESNEACQQESLVNVYIGAISNRDANVENMNESGETYQPEEEIDLDRTSAVNQPSICQDESMDTKNLSKSIGMDCNISIGTDEMDVGEISCHQGSEVTNDTDLTSIATAVQNCKESSEDGSNATQCPVVKTDIIITNSPQIIALDLKVNASTVSSVDNCKYQSTYKSTVCEIRSVGKPVLVSEATCETMDSAINCVPSAITEVAVGYDDDAKDSVAVGHEKELCHFVVPIAQPKDEGSLPLVEGVQEYAEDLSSAKDEPSSTLMPPCSPVLFSPEEDGNCLLEPPSPSDSVPEYSMEMLRTMSEDTLVSHLRDAVSGVPPPPAVTIPLIDCANILECTREAFASTPTSCVPIDTPSASLFKPTVSLEEVILSRWPEMRHHQYFDIYYNRSNKSEELEQLTQKLVQRCVGNETASTCNMWFPHGATRKRKKETSTTSKQIVDYSVKKKLVFTNSILNSNSERRQILIEPKKPVTTRDKSVVPKKKLFVEVENHRNSSVKTAVESEVRGKPISRSKSSGYIEVNNHKRHISRRLSKRADFSRGSQALAASFGQNSFERNTVNGETHTCDCGSVSCKTGSECKLHRLRGSSDNRALPRHASDRKKCSDQNLPQNGSLPYSPSYAPPGDLSELHKQKLRRAVVQALQQKGIEKTDSLFKPCGRQLFVLCRVLLPDLIGPRDNRHSRDGSTSARMLTLATQHVKDVIDSQQNIFSADKLVSESKLQHMDDFLFDCRSQSSSLTSTPYSETSSSLEPQSSQSAGL